MKSKTNGKHVGRRAQEGAPAPVSEGRELHEPGKPTRGTPPDADADTVKIARQQGTSQRGYTEDRPARKPPSSSNGAGKKP